jgi:predicted dehydrogenase
MKIILFGLGSIGLRQATILRSLDHDLVAFRSAPGHPNRLGLPEIFTWEEARAMDADTAFITNPTHLHVATAIACAKMGLDIFIEKPLSDSLEGLDELERVCKSNEVTCYIAYGLRFHPVIKSLKAMVGTRKVNHVRIACSSYLPTWRQDQDWKKSYSRSKARGGGVILDLSHEFDYVEYLFGRIESAKSLVGRGSEITIDAEDYADVLIETEKGIPINLHLDFISRFNERRIVVDCEDESIEGDLIANRMTRTNGDLVSVDQFTESRDDYLREQIEYFLDHLGDKDIMNGLREARGLLERILVIRNG